MPAKIAVAVVGAGAAQPGKVAGMNTKRHPFAVAFSERRMAQPNSRTRCAPSVAREIEREEDAHADGRRLTAPAPLSDASRKALRREEEEGEREFRKRRDLEEEETFVRITPQGRARLEASRAQRLIAEKKAAILEKLRAAGDDEPTMLQNLCVPLDLTIEAAMLLIFEINDFRMSLMDADETKPFISLFFNGDSGEVWAELFDGDKPCKPQTGGAK